MSTYNWKRRQFLKAAGLSLLSINAFPMIQQCQQSINSEYPNILFILTDQHRQDGVGAYGKEQVITPNLDRLADNGIRFNNMYTAQPVCAPNRASIQSGLYPHSHGVLENTWALSPRIQSLAEMLISYGYDCAYFGKWHLDRNHTQGYKTFPDYPNDGRGSSHYFEIDGKKRYAPEVITDDVISFISQERSEPFLAFASFYPPHPPYSVPEEYEKRYQNIFPQDERRRIYYANCTAVDDQIGRLLSTLEQHDLDQNTLVIFTSEHGHFFEHRWNDHSKRLCYDTAAVVPLIMRMPDTIPGGQVSDALISSVDFPQTILGLLNIPIPQGLQGVDMSEIVRGESPSKREAVFMVNFPYINKGETPGKYSNEPSWLRGEERAVRTENWKLILSDKREPELYDMNQDEQEVNNLWTTMEGSAVTDQLLLLLHQWGVATGDDLAPKLTSQYF